MEHEGSQQSFSGLISYPQCNAGHVLEWFSPRCLTCEMEGFGLGFSYLGLVTGQKQSPRMCPCTAHGVCSCGWGSGLGPVARGWVGESCVGWGAGQQSPLKWGNCSPALLSLRTLLGNSFSSKMTSACGISFASSLFT